MKLPPAESHYFPAWLIRLAPGAAGAESCPLYLHFRARRHPGNPSWREVLRRGILSLLRFMVPFCLATGFSIASAHYELTHWAVVFGLIALGTLLLQAVRNVSRNRMPRSLAAAIAMPTRNRQMILDLWMAGVRGRDIQRVVMLERCETVVAIRPILLLVPLFLGALALVASDVPILSGPGLALCVVYGLFALFLVDVACSVLVQPMEPESETAGDRNFSPTPFRADVAMPLIVPIWAITAAGLAGILGALATGHLLGLFGIYTVPRVSCCYPPPIQPEEVIVWLGGIAAFMAALGFLGSRDEAPPRGQALRADRDFETLVCSKFLDDPDAVFWVHYRYSTVAVFELVESPRMVPGCSGSADEATLETVSRPVAAQ